MNPELFSTDLERKPEMLAALASTVQSSNPWHGTGIDASSHVILLGMGSSHYANAVAAARLRSRGVDAVAELASSDLLPRSRPSTVVVAVSASGGSAETLAAVEQYQGRARVIGVTNVAGSRLEGLCDAFVPMQAGVEEGGVACRSFQHTLALLLTLEELLTGTTIAGVPAHESILCAAEASADLLDRRGEWLEAFSTLALGPDSTAFVAPHRRLSSALQGALMVREGPRRPAVGCETGDWSHVDVYLTKTTDYRLVLFEGSRWQPELLSWVQQRGSVLISVGGAVDGAHQVLRYRHDDLDDVRLLTEVLVAELASAKAWNDQSLGR